MFLAEQNKGVYANADGMYRFDNLPSGKITIQFSFTGYNTVVKTLMLTKGNKEINATLSEAVIETQQVVITGGAINSQHDNAVKIDVLKSRDILLSGSANLTESLTKIPGVDMIAKGQGVSKPVIRGLSMNEILVMNNGVRIENYQFSEDHPLGVDNNDVDRVEIIKGPASLLYGSDAIGGVINFIKDKPAAKNQITGDYQGQLHSNTMGVNNSLGIKGASDHFFSGLRLTQKTHEDYKQSGGVFVPNSRFNEWSLSAHTGFTGKTGTFKMYYDYFKQDLGMAVPPVIPVVTEPGRKNNIWYQNLAHHLISSQNKLYLGLFKWEINAAYQSALRKLNIISTAPSVEMNLNTLTYETKLNFSPKENADYTFGIQGMSQNNLNRNNREAQFLPDADIKNLGLLTFAQYTFIQKIKFQGGLRYDFYSTQTHAMGNSSEDTYHAPVSKNYNSLSGSAGITYNLNEKLLFRGNFAKAYRVPNLSELTSNGEHGERFEIGNNTLQPEDAKEWDLSVHYHSNLFSFDIAGFYNNISDYIYIRPTNDTSSSGLMIYKFFQTDAVLSGGEAGLHFHPVFIPWLHIKGVYTAVTGKQSNGDYLPFIPAQKFHYEIRAERENLGVMYHPNIWLSALTVLRQSTPSFFETETPGYSLFNGGFNTELKVKNQFFSIGFSINNIFDTRYFDHLSTLKPIGFYNQGRNVCIFLKIPFAITNKTNTTN
ncbi:MAG: putative TonB-dependent receptor precursor [Bacteroidetes bacterium ADurb.Bin408]|nr:MAG: putative TonB-dependent receptor precursor [Bacteroidetes bacterium ADurb.Bin408]